VVEIHIPGALLARVLDQGVANAGTGGFLQTSGVDRSADGAWRVGGAPLDPDRDYVVGTSDFLASGRETGLDYFDAETNPDIQGLTEHGDVRRALLAELICVVLNLSILLARSAGVRAALSAVAEDLR
jgi:5'-nucleotidase